MHFDGARAEHQRVRNFGVGLPLGNEAQNFVLAARQVAGAEAAGRPRADALGQRFAQLRKRLGDLRGERARAKLAGRAVGAGEVRHSGVAPIRSCAGHSRAELRAGVAEWHRDIAQQVERLGKLLRGLLRLAVEQGDLAQSVRQRRQCFGLSSGAGDLGQGVGTGASIGTGTLAGKQRDRPAQGRDYVMAIFDLLPAVEHSAAVLGGSGAIAIQVVEQRQAPGSHQFHRRQLDALGQRRRLKQQGAGVAWLAALHIQRAKHAAGDRAGVRRAMF